MEEQSPRPKILLVINSINEPWNTLIKNYSFDFSIIKSVKSILSKLAKTNFEALIIDDSIKEEISKYLVSSIREYSEINKQPVILFAQNDMADNMQKCIRYGFNGILYKSKLPAVLMNDLLVYMGDQRTSYHTGSDQMQDMHFSFQNIADHNPDMVSLYDFEGTVLYINNSFANTIQKKPNEVAGKNIQDIAPTAYGNKYLAIIRKVIDTGEEFREVTNIVFINREKSVEFRILPVDSEIPGKRLALMLGHEINIEDATKNDFATKITNFGYLIENSPNAISVIDHHGNHLFANEQASILTGYPHEELMKINMSHLTVKEEIESSKQILKNKLDGSDTQVEYSTRIRTKSGTIKFVEIKTVTTTWMNEPAIIVLANDITEKVQLSDSLIIQRQAELILSQNDNFLQSLKKLSDLIRKISWIKGGGFYLIDGKTRGMNLIYHFNLPRSFYKNVLKYSPDSPNIKMLEKRESLYLSYKQVQDITNLDGLEYNIDLVCILPLIQNNELIGSLNLAVFGKNTLDENERMMLDLLASKIGDMLLRVKAREELKRTVENLEKKFIERTAKLREVNQNLLQEIKENIRSKKALHIAENKYLEIQRNLPLGIFRTTQKGALLTVNPASIELFGYASESEMLSINVAELYFDRSERESAIYELLSKGFIKNYEIRLMKKDGSSFWGSLDVKTVYNEHNKLLFFDGVISDITSRKQMREELDNAHNKIKKTNENLEKRIQKEIKKLNDQQIRLIQKSKLESLGELSAGIAHEVNQPLGLITMSLENMYMQVSEGKATREYIKRKMDSVLNQISRIQKIIDHIRIFSRDQHSITLERIDVNQAIYNALSLLGSQYRNHGIDLKLNLNPNMGFTIGNLHKLEQVIMNLLSNSKYAVDQKAKGTLKGNFNKTISISTYTEFSEIYIEIEDNGSGISPSNLKRIFDPFFTTKEEKMGTGLGLSIVYGIIKEMNGEIQVRSREEMFTRVLLKFPLMTI